MAESETMPAEVPEEEIAETLPEEAKNAVLQKAAEVLPEEAENAGKEE